MTSCCCVIALNIASPTAVQISSLGADRHQILARFHVLGLKNFISIRSTKEKSIFLALRVSKKLKDVQEGIKRQKKRQQQKQNEIESSC